jgi:hypothetical protein
MNFSFTLIVVFVTIAAIGIVSSFLYARQRLWISAGAVLIAAVSLIFLLGDFPLLTSFTSAEKVIVLGEDAPSPKQIEEIQAASKIILQGDGLREAQWHDLPSRRLEWTPPVTPSLQLDFPRQLQLGRMLVVSAKLTAMATNWRLQLLAENGELLAESDKAEQGLERRVAWLPPLAEQLVLRARVIDEAGKILDQGPIPVIVQDSQELQVIGRFAAPSFDAQTLNNLLVMSKANLDWQVSLGKTVTRSETARKLMTAPQLTIIDAAYFEKLNTAARSSLLAQVAEGMPLLVLAGNLSQPALWASSLDLHLLAAPANASQEDLHDVGSGMQLANAEYLPAANKSGAWTANSAEKPWLWQRPWQAGRILWLGVADWHRYAISSPQSLALWWQAILDQAQIKTVDAMAWTDQQAMPLIGERTAFCVQGLNENEIEIPHQRIPLMHRPDQVDAKCAAIWPQQEGWQTIKSANSSHAMFVYAKTDWPLWQRAQKRQATLDYASRLPSQASSTSKKALAPWPFALLFALSMLLIWWQDRR